jgi:hypothetical protein
MISHNGSRKVRACSEPMHNLNQLASRLTMQEARSHGNCTEEKLVAQ